MPSKVKYITDMVKVILCESTTDCGIQLQQICALSQSHRILVYQSSFLERLHQFYPQLELKNFRTPTTLLRECGFEPLSEAAACELDTESPFSDPAALKTQEPSNPIRTWWDVSPGAIKPTWDLLCFLGPWDKRLQEKIYKSFQGSTIQTVILERTFASIDPCSNFSVTALPNSSAEIFWVQQHWEGSKSPLIALPHTPYQTLEQRSIPFLIQAWIDWQSQPTIRTFLVYLSTCVSSDDFQRHKKDIDQAQNACFSEQFALIKNVLIANGKTWIASFKLLSEPDMDGQEGLPEEIRQVWDRLSLWRNRVSEAVVWQRLRRLLQRQAGIELRCIPWEEAIYLPLHGGFIPHAIQTGKQSDTLVRQWLCTLNVEAEAFHLTYPINGESGHPFQPLIPSTTTPSIDFKCTGQGMDPTATLNFLPPLKLSCKQWERFALCPQKTWVETLMKAENIPLTVPLLKAKHLGEAVHENLYFKQSPQSKDAWFAQVRKNAQVRWETLLKNHPQPSAYLLQWHQRALQISLNIAQSASAYFKPHRQCFSEWTLPKGAPYSGRIDLFICDSETEEAYVIDYKTALHYIFSETYINKGQGLQLYLYGQALKSHFKTIYLMVIHPHGDVSTLDFNQINASNIEHWLHQIQTLGTYPHPPQEKLSSLPLGYTQN